MFEISSCSGTSSCCAIPLAKLCDVFFFQMARTHQRIEHLSLQISSEKPVDME